MLHRLLHGWNMTAMKLEHFKLDTIYIISLMHDSNHVLFSSFRVFGQFQSLMTRLLLSWDSADFWWNIDPHKTQKVASTSPRVKIIPLVSHGANLFNLCPFPDSFALYVHNLFPIGPAVRLHFPVFWIVDPLTPLPEYYSGVSWGELFLAYMSIPRWIHRRVSNLVPIGPAVWQLSQTCICDPIKPPEMPPGVCKGRIVFSLAYSVLPRFSKGQGAIWKGHI